MSYSKLNNLFPEKKCKKCGNIFIAAPMHRFREGRAFYCSWTCFLHRHDTHKKSTLITKGNQEND